MKQVPFYSNTPDDTHCYQAALKMVLKYFLPDKDYSWKDLEKFTAKKEGLWTWPTQSFMNLINLGFDVIDIDDMDNKKFIEEGGQYLINKYGKEVGEKQIERSDIKQEIRLMKKYEKYGKHKIQMPTFKMLEELLDQGYLVVCNINAYKLNDKPGYAGHFVVTYGYRSKNLHLHDPGLPAMENRIVSYEQFKKAWDYPNENARNLMAFRLPNQSKD